MMRTNRSHGVGAAAVNYPKTAPERQTQYITDCTREIKLPMKSNLREKYSGWGRGGEKYEPAEFQGRTNRRDDFITDNSLLESLASEYSHHGHPRGILHPSRPGPSVMRPSADLRVRFASPRQQRIEEEIAYHSFELKNLAMELDATKSVHGQGTGYNRGNGHSYSDQYASSGGDDSSTLLSHDAFSVEASIDYVKPKTSSKWKRSGSPFRARGRDRSKSPGRGGDRSLAEKSSDRGRSKSPHRNQESRSDRGRSPGRAVGRDRDAYYDL